MSRRKVLVVVLIALVFSIGAGAMLRVLVEPPGYCRAQQRYITDEEFIRASVALLDWYMNLEVETYPERKKGKAKDMLNIYNDIDFNPNKRSGWRVSSTDSYGENLQNRFRRLLGWQEVYVTWHIKTHTTPRDIDTSNMGFRYSVCGELLDSSMGLRNRAIK